MFSAQVVEDVCTFEEGDLDVAVGLPVVTSYQFGFQRLEEALDGGIVIAVAFPAHRSLEPVLADQFLIVVSIVLRSEVRVMNAPWRRPSDHDCHVQRPQG